MREKAVATMNQNPTLPTASPSEPKRAWDPVALLDGILLLVLFLSWTTPLGIPADGLPFSVPEICVIVYILWKVATLPKERAKPGQTASVLIWGCWLAVAWIGIVWMLADNWAARRSPLMDWTMAVALFTLLVVSPPKNRPGITAFTILFVLAALPNAAAGISQLFWGSGLRHKNLLGWNWRVSSTPIRGFFSSPNDLAIYMFWTLTLAVGLAQAERRWNLRRIAFSCLAVLFGLVLFCTYSRLALVAAVCALAGIFLLPRLPRKRLLQAAAAVPLILVGLAAWISTFYPLRKLFSGRLALWQRTFRILFEEPSRAVIGFLSTEQVRRNSVWWIPHNIYLLAWMEFGILGFLGLILLAVFILAHAWIRYDSLRTDRLSAALTVGMVGMLFIIGMGSLYLYEGFTLFIFFGLLALWTNLIRTSDPQTAASA
jgi:hypothetical protein